MQHQKRDFFPDEDKRHFSHTLLGLPLLEPFKVELNQRGSPTFRATNLTSDGKVWEKWPALEEWPNLTACGQPMTSMESCAYDRSYRATLWCTDGWMLAGANGPVLASRNFGEHSNYSYKGQHRGLWYSSHMHSALLTPSGLFRCPVKASVSSKALHTTTSSPLLQMDM